MSFESQQHRHRLPRLPVEFYRGQNWIHWTMALEDRSTGWLTPVLHAQLREWLCHALGRHRILCPAYCLMPDHAHFLWIGWDECSDQRKAAAVLRMAWNAALRQSGRALQRQAHDHVLREEARAQGAFVTVATYVLENPVRAELCGNWREYPHLGAMVPGYPVLDLRTDDYWDKFWRILALHLQRGGAESLTASATTTGSWRNA
jgi:putative transposase